MIKKLLVALSGTPFTPSAIRHVLEIAKLDKNAIVTGVTLVDIDRIEDVGMVPLGGGAGAHALREQRKEQVRRRIEEEIATFETACKEVGVRFKVEYEERETFDELCHLWRYHDLTVIGLRGLFDYGVISSPDDMVAELINRRVRPILAVAEEYRPIRRILMAYNGSMASAKAFKRVIRMNLWPDAQVKLLVINRDDEAPRLLADAAEYCRVYGYEPETEHAHSESPRDDLLRFAEEWKADLLVMGTVSKQNFLKKLILGSMTAKALRNATMPLFLTQ